MPEETTHGDVQWHDEAIDAESRPLEPKTAILTAEPPAPVPPAVEAKETAETIPAAKAATLRAILKNIRDSIDGALRLIDETAPELPPSLAASLVAPVLAAKKAAEASEIRASGDDRVIEGVFDGEGMVGDDGKTYLVPPNYASKSKLVEGDMLKLTIGPRGNFIYKQIGPIERQRLIGVVAFNQDAGIHIVVAGGRSWKVLKASITYFKAEVGDEAVILVPKQAPSKWAAVENVIRKGPQQAIGGLIA